jgi:hypothetical protein
MLVAGGLVLVGGSFFSGVVVAGAGGSSTTGGVVVATISITAGTLVAGASAVLGDRPSVTSNKVAKVTPMMNIARRARNI